MKTDIGNFCSNHFSVYSLKIEYLKVLEYKLVIEESPALP